MSILDAKNWVACDVARSYIHRFFCGFYDHFCKRKRCKTENMIYDFFLRKFWDFGKIFYYRVRSFATNYEKPFSTLKWPQFHTNRSPTVHIIQILPTIFHNWFDVPIFVPNHSQPGLVISCNILHHIVQFL